LPEDARTKVDMLNPVKSMKGEEPINVKGGKPGIEKEGGGLQDSAED